MIMAKESKTFIYFIYQQKYILYFDQDEFQKDQNIKNSIELSFFSNYIF